MIKLTDIRFYSPSTHPYVVKMLSILNCSKRFQSTLWENMAALHFTTIPFQPNTTNRHIESHIFCEVRPCTNNIVNTRLKFLELFCAFLWALRIMDNCTSRHLFRYSVFCSHTPLFSWRFQFCSPKKVIFYEQTDCNNLWAGYHVSPSHMTGCDKPLYFGVFNFVHLANRKMKCRWNDQRRTKEM